MIQCSVCGVLFPGDSAWAASNKCPLCEGSEIIAAGQSPERRIARRIVERLKKFVEALESEIENE